DGPNGRSHSGPRGRSGSGRRQPRRAARAGRQIRRALRPASGGVSMTRGFGAMLPAMRTAPPGPRSRKLAEELARYESPNVTYLADDFPVFWSEARGANVRDVDDNVYVDLTAAFAVAVAGHAHPTIVRAVADQASRLM